MSKRLSLLADPMVVVLLIATTLAFVAPAVGEGAGRLSGGFQCGNFRLVSGQRDAHCPGRDRARIGQLAVFSTAVCVRVWRDAVDRHGHGDPCRHGLAAIGCLGVLYLGTLPSTVQSATSYTALADGNVALSVVGAALLNIAGVFVTAPIFALLAGARRRKSGPRQLYGSD